MTLSHLDTSLSFLSCLLSWDFAVGFFSFLIVHIVSPHCILPYPPLPPPTAILSSLNCHTQKLSVTHARTRITLLTCCISLDVSPASYLISSRISPFSSCISLSLTHSFASLLSSHCTSGWKITLFSVTFPFLFMPCSTRSNLAPCSHDHESHDPLLASL
ncbi:hypothetical protein BC835DRAFT_1400086, partial [Cytidiella melzeri]